MVDEGSLYTSVDGNGDNAPVINHAEEVLNNRIAVLIRKLSLSEP